MEKSMEPVRTRGEVEKKYTWDLTRIFESNEAWEAMFAAVQADARAFSGRAGTLSGGEEAVLSALDAYMEMARRTEALYTYAMMRQNEDSTVGRYQAMYSRAATLANEVSAQSAFLTPELTALPDGVLEKMMQSPAFADYDAFLKGVLRMKPHTLSAREEQLLAMAGEVANVPDQAYEMLAGADLDLGRTRGENGEKVPLTDAGLLQLLSSPQRAVRRSAYGNIMAGYGRMGNTFAALYAGQVKADLFAARARGYASAREAALYPDEIEEAVYDSLIEAVHSGIGTLDAYLAVRKKQLGVPVLHLYDLYAEPEQGFDISPDIEEAFEIFLKAVAPLGEDYVRDASRALSERWIDVYETKNKRSGAYSCSGAPWTTPYVLLNHKPTYDGLSTLCHEMGHAMHTFYASKAQPYAKADYTIFVAEVASTCNEILLCEYLRAEYAGNRRAQIALIGSLLEHFRTTVFRQTLFAEFERDAHRLAEQGESLTRERLCALYYDLNRRYYGRSCKVDRDVQNEWMRIPHFYSPFYVYKYATGFCAAVALVRGILSGDPQKRADYRRFLTLGGSMPPLEELRVAGVDMFTPEPVCQALDYFAELIMEYSALVESEA